VASDQESIIHALADSLGQYLVSEIGELEEYYPEFPQQNEEIEIPSVSIISSSNQFRALPPYQCEDTGTVKKNKAQIMYAVGIYDITLQVDLWARNKAERDELYRLAFDALNPDIQPMGLRLVVEEYYGQIANLLYTDHELPDNGESSQVDEWRAILTVQATCKAIRCRSEFIITETQTAAEIEDAGQIDETVIVSE